MPASRLVQWVSRFRAPRPTQWRSGPAPVGRFASSNAPRRKRAPRRSRTRAPSIFNQLFPRGIPAPGPSGSRSNDADVLAADDALSEEEDGDGNVVEAAWRKAEEEDEGSIPREGDAVLVVRNGSKSTLPSDFYRVAPRGKHLDGRGWSTMQATQARHPVTMDPLDKYILHFPTVHAAKAYKSELERLVSSPSPSESRLTLCPPDPSSLSVELVSGRNPISRVPGARVPNDIMRRGLDSRNLVHIQLEGSQLMLDEISDLVKADGEQRRLAWKLKGSWGAGGISVSLRGWAPTRKAEEPEPVDGAADVEDDTAAEQWRRKPPPEDYFSRFYLSFQTVHDARRFIRSWHRRTLNVGNEHRACIVNASLIW